MTYQHDIPNTTYEKFPKTLKGHNFAQNGQIFKIQKLGDSEN